MKTDIIEDQTITPGKADLIKNDVHTGYPNVNSMIFVMIKSQKMIRMVESTKALVVELFKPTAPPLVVKPV